MGAVRILKGCLFWAAAVNTAVVVGVVLYFPARHLLGRHLFTPPVEGRVTDAVTGEPVPQLLVTADWTFRTPAIVDSSGWGEAANALTDADGRFRIDARDVSKVWSYYDGMTLHFRHPLYDFKMRGVGAEEAVRARRAAEIATRLQLDTQVMTLEDRYSTPEDNAELGYALAGVKPEFFLRVQQQFGVTYDIDAVLDELARLAHRHSLNSSVKGSHVLPREYKALLVRFGRTPAD